MAPMGRISQHFEVFCKGTDLLNLENLNRSRRKEFSSQGYELGLTQ
jgi:hypothetical protein